MSDFALIFKCVVVCGTFAFVAFIVLLSLPQCKLRAVGKEAAKWFAVCGLALLVVSPIDVVPDVVVVAGWLDDLAYVGGAICTARSALNDRRKRLLLATERRS